MIHRKRELNELRTGEYAKELGCYTYLDKRKTLKYWKEKHESTSGKRVFEEENLLPLTIPLLEIPSEQRRNLSENYEVLTLNSKEVFEEETPALSIIPFTGTVNYSLNAIKPMETPKILKDPNHHDLSTTLNSEEVLNSEDEKKPTSSMIPLTDVAERINDSLALNCSSFDIEEGTYDLCGSSMLQEDIGDIILQTDNPEEDIFELITKGHEVAESFLVVPENQQVGKNFELLADEGIEPVAENFELVPEDKQVAATVISIRTNEEELVDKTPEETIDNPTGK
ncbi:hypothetical protein J6590_107027 [Homalodisca vitripennis]|nr:hypothetical protein J6590_107027 [Homalodisca vitripennis]